MGISKKKYKRHKWHPKMNPRRKFHSNWTMGKCSKSRGNVWGVGGIQRGAFRKKKTITPTVRVPDCYSYQLLLAIIGFRMRYYLFSVFILIIYFISCLKCIISFLINIIIIVCLPTSALTQQGYLMALSASASDSRLQNGSLFSVFILIIYFISCTH